MRAVASGRSGTLPYPSTAVFSARLAGLANKRTIEQVAYQPTEDSLPFVKQPTGTKYRSSTRAAGKERKKSE